MKLMLFYWKQVKNSLENQPLDQDDDDNNDDYDDDGNGNDDKSNGN